MVETETRLNILGLLENGLFALGQVLRFPVMALLWVCVIAAIFMAGACVVEFARTAARTPGFNLQRGSVGRPGVADGAAARCRRPCARCWRRRAEQPTGTLANGGSSTCCWSAKNASATAW